MKIILEVRTIKYAGLIKNDIAGAPGMCVSFFTQGCPFHCEGCHNPETWDYDGGRDFTENTMEELIEALRANNVHRDLCIMGGEPLCSPNIPLVKEIIMTIKKKLPNTKIYLWTGYELSDLQNTSNTDLEYILEYLDCIVDGPYIEKERDITLHMRGSHNQNIWIKGDNGEWINQ